MAIASVLFFLIGLFLRNALREMVKEVQLRQAEDERQAAAEEAQRKREEKAQSASEKTAGKLFDQKVGGDDKEDLFSPGRVADFIRQEMDNP